MSKILWLHHFETMWDESYQKFDLSFDQVMDNVLDYIEATQPDKVIVTRFEDIHPEYEHHPLIELCRSEGIPLEFKEYGYGFYRDVDDPERAEGDYPTIEFNETWTYGERDHHDGERNVIELHDWHHELKSNGDHVELAGAFVDECLNDAEVILNTLDIPYTNIDELQVGSFVTYTQKIEREDELDDEYDYDEEMRYG